MNTTLTPLSLDQVADNLERLLLRYEELQRANALLQEQLLEVTQERDTLRSRLAAARARVDTLLERLPVNETSTAAPGTGTPDAHPGSGAASTSGAVAAPTSSLLTALSARQTMPESGAAPAAWGEENA